MTCHKSVLALLLSSALVAPVFAQAPKPQSQAAKPATIQAGAPSSPAPAKWIPPMKGDGTVEVIKGQPRRVGSDMVTTLKIRNTSKGALALLVVDEYWYPAATTQVVSGDTQRHRALLNPGEIVEITLKSPYHPQMARSQYDFRHAHGKITVKEVSRFPADTVKK
jgi:hypothetical protein